MKARLPILIGASIVICGYLWHDFGQLASFSRESPATANASSPDPAGHAIVATGSPAVSLKVDEHITQRKNRDDPESAIYAELDAMRQGDVTAVANALLLTPEARALIESAMVAAPHAIMRDHSTPEQLAAFIFCGAQRVEAFKIESTRIDQLDQAIHRISFKFENEPQWRTEEIVMRQLPGGWRRVIDINLARRVAAILGPQSDAIR